MASGTSRKASLSKAQQEELDHIEWRLMQIGGASQSHREAMNKLASEAMTLQARREELSGKR